MKNHGREIRYEAKRIVVILGTSCTEVLNFVLFHGQMHHLIQDSPRSLAADIASEVEGHEESR